MTAAPLNLVKKITAFWEVRRLFLFIICFLKELLFSLVNPQLLG